MDPIEQWIRKVFDSQAPLGVVFPSVHATYSVRSRIYRTLKEMREHADTSLMADSIVVKWKKSECLIELSYRGKCASMEAITNALAGLGGKTIEYEDSPEGRESIAERSSYDDLARAVESSGLTPLWTSLDLPFWVFSPPLGHPDNQPYSEPLYLYLVSLRDEDGPRWAELKKLCQLD